MNIKVGELIVSNPRRCYESVVAHSDTRNLLPLEWAILKSISMFKGRELLLKVVLKEVFSINQVDGIIIEILEYFKNFKLIQTDNIYFELDKLNISDITLTEEGEQFLETNFIPTEEMNDNIKSYYDLISRTVIKGKEDATEEPEGVILGYEDYDEEYPVDLIKEYVEKNKSKLLQKASKTSKILSVQQKSREVLWANKTIFLNFSEDGVIKISGLTREELDIFMEEYEGKIESLFFRNDLGSKDITVIDSSILNKISETIDIKTSEFHIKNHIKTAVVDVLNDKHFNYEEELLNKNISNKVLVLPREGRENLIEEVGTNLVIFSDDILPKHIKYLDKDGNNFCKVYLKGNFYGETIMIPMAFKLKKEHVRYEVDMLLTTVENAIDKAVEEDFAKILYKRNLKSESELWQECCEKIEETDRDLKDKIYILENISKELNQTSKKQGIKWLDDIGEIILYNLSQNTETFEEAKNLLKHIEKKGIWSETKFAERLVSLLEERLKNIDGYKEVLEINKFIHDLGVSNTINIRNYSQNVIGELLDKYPTEEINTVKDLTVIEKNLKKLKELERVLLQKYKLREIFIEEEMKIRVKKLDIEVMLSLIEEWNKSLCELMNSNKSFEVAFINTFLHEKTELFNCYKDFFKRYSCRIPEGYKNILVIDTNVLIDDPELLNKAQKGDYFILPKKVINELDKKKLDQDTEEAADEALRNLNRYKGNNIIYEEGNMKLLSDDYDKNGDNLILSIALKYRVSKPMLITNDNGLQLKARAEGIDVMTREEFLNRKEEKTNKITKKQSWAGKKSKKK